MLNNVRTEEDMSNKKELDEIRALMSTSVAEDHDLISRLSRKLNKVTKQNVELRKYAQHKLTCTIRLDAGCNCGLEPLLKPKRQEPI